MKFRHMEYDPPIMNGDGYPSVVENGNRDCGRLPFDVGIKINLYIQCFIGVDDVRI